MRSTPNPWGGCAVAPVAVLRYCRRMVRPYNERDAWGQERAELPAQIAALQGDLDATPIENTPRRERLTWTIRRAERRMAELEEAARAGDAAPS